MDAHFLANPQSVTSEVGLAIHILYHPHLIST